MLQNVYQLSEWITDIEPTHSPRFTVRAVLDRDTCSFDSLQSGFDIVNLNGQIWDGRASPAFRGEADLNCHFRICAVCSYPAKIHNDLKAENLVIKDVCLVYRRCFDVRDDAFNFQLRLPRVSAVSVPPTLASIWWTLQVKPYGGSHLDIASASREGSIQFLGRCAEHTMKSNGTCRHKQHSSVRWEGPLRKCPSIVTVRWPSCEA
jgi:hypothetical protein